MQPKGRCEYIFDSTTQKWVPWEGTTAGFGGVTLFTPGGQPIDTSSGADDDYTPGFLLGVGNFNYAYDAGQDNWDRVRAFGNDADDVTPTPLGLMGVGSFLFGFSIATSAWDRVQAYAFDTPPLDPADTASGWVGTIAGLSMFDETGTAIRALTSADSGDDQQGGENFGWLRAVGIPYLFNGGGTFDRQGSATSINLAAQSGVRSALVAEPGEWTLTNAPAADTVATASKAAGGAGFRHVCRSITANINAVAAIAAPLTVCVRDGATGVGTILWQARLTALAGTTAGVALSGLNIVGSENAAMTIEFTAAPGATNFETVNATGYTSGTLAT